MASDSKGRAEIERNIWVVLSSLADEGLLEQDDMARFAAISLDETSPRPFTDTEMTWARAAILRGRENERNL